MQVNDGEEREGELGHPFRSADGTVSILARYLGTKQCSQPGFYGVGRRVSGCSRTHWQNRVYFKFQTRSSAFVPRRCHGNNIAGPLPDIVTLQAPAEQRWPLASGSTRRLRFGDLKRQDGGQLLRLSDEPLVVSKLAQLLPSWLSWLSWLLPCPGSGPPPDNMQTRRRCSGWPRRYPPPIQILMMVFLSAGRSVTSGAAELSIARIAAR
jgi:hypothetical protein